MLQKNQFADRIGGLVDRGEGKDPTTRNAIFMWKDTIPFRVIYNYHGSDLSEVQRKQRNCGFRNVTRVGRGSKKIYRYAVAVNARF